jgi:hypothetical protein
MKYPLLFFILSITACSYIEEDFTPDTESLNYYLEQFEFEAAQRGFKIDLDELELSTSISEIDKDGVAGTCHYSSATPNRVVIDKSFWEKSSSMLREMVVFHELGHCVLGRGHRESMDSNGACISIMQSGLGQCQLLYNEVNRLHYVNELFFPSNY